MQDLKQPNVDLRTLVLRSSVGKWHSRFALVHAQSEPRYLRCLELVVTLSDTDRRVKVKVKDGVFMCCAST